MRLSFSSLSPTSSAITTAHLSQVGCCSTRCTAHTRHIMVRCKCPTITAHHYDLSLFPATRRQSARHTGHRARSKVSSGSLEMLASTLPYQEGRPSMHDDYTPIRDMRQYPSPISVHFRFGGPLPWVWKYALAPTVLCFEKASSYVEHILNLRGSRNTPYVHAPGPYRPRSC